MREVKNNTSIIVSILLECYKKMAQIYLKLTKGVKRIINLLPKLSVIYKVEYFVVL